MSIYTRKYINQCGSTLKVKNRLPLILSTNYKLCVCIQRSKGLLFPLHVFWLHWPTPYYSPFKEKELCSVAKHSLQIKVKWAKMGLHKTSVLSHGWCTLKKPSRRAQMKTGGKKKASPKPCPCPQEETCVSASILCVDGCDVLPSLMSCWH